MKTKLFFNLILFVVLFVPSLVTAQTNEFTYQGRLTDGSMAANANYDFEFRLYDAAAGGNLLGTQTRLGVAVTNGVFTVLLNFGAQFTGAARYLEIGVKPAGSANPFTLLAPRQPFTSAPYAIKSLNSTTADNANNLGGVAANQFVRTTDGRLTDSRNPLAGSSNYIQNRTTQQSGTTNFNISGNGTIGGTLTATTVNGNIISGVITNSGVYRIGNENVLKNFGTRNIFAGVKAGGTGTDNSFFGYDAGNANLATGIDNSFFGSDAGGVNTSGRNNSFFGSDAGDFNTTGSNNTIIGSGADVGSSSLSYATAIGAGASVSTSNTIQLGRSNGVDSIYLPGEIIVAQLSFGGSANVCRTDSLKLSVCSSSLRYKRNIAPFSFGLNLVKRLRPITFNWKDGGMADLGLGAEDVAEVEPLLVNYNKDGQVEGVKYDRIGVVLLNAVKEQQTQIEQQQKQLQQQQLVIDGLRKFVCQSNSQAEVCKEEK